MINVGGGSSVTMLDVVELAATVTGRPVPISAAPPQVGDVAATAADLGLARRLLGFRPEVGLREGMVRHADWLSSVPDALRTRLMSSRPLEIAR